MRSTLTGRLVWVPVFLIFDLPVGLSPNMTQNPQPTRLWIRPKGIPSDRVSGLFGGLSDQHHWWGAQP